MVDTAPHRCNIFVFDLLKHIGVDSKHVWSRKVAQVFPRGDADLHRWMHNSQYSAEAWVMRALDKHPWRVDSEAKADLNFIRINATLLSESGIIGGLVIARKILGELYKSGNLTAPPAIVLANTRGTWDEGAPGRTILFADSHQGIPMAHNQWATTGVMPYVQSKPELAVTAHGKPSPMLREVARNLPAWAQRPLLFFVGHVPKVTISATRWNIWAAVHNEKDVTTRSHSVHCTVGQFAICEDPKRLQNVTVSGEFQTYCHEMCKTPSDPRIRYTDGRVLPAPCRGRNGNGLMADCKKIHAKGVRLTPALIEALHESRRATRAQVARGDTSNCSGAFASTGCTRAKLPFAKWAAEAMQHRFCVVAAGDYPGTPKIAEFALFGAAGGCIPLVVVSAAAEPARHTLPFRRWFDWCDYAYLVSDRANFTRILQRLRRVTADEAAAKHAALARIRRAFYWEPPFDMPDGSRRMSPAEIIIAEACAIAREIKAGTLPHGTPTSRTSVKRCLMA